MKSSVRRYSSSALMSAKKKVNAFNRAEGTVQRKIDRLRTEIEKLEAEKAPAYVIRLKTNDLLLHESKYKRIQCSRVKATQKYRCPYRRPAGRDAVRQNTELKIAASEGVSCLI